MAYEDFRFPSWADPLQLSIAISLKRIADAMEGVDVMAEAKWTDHDAAAWGASAPPVATVGGPVEVEFSDGTRRAGNKSTAWDWSNSEGLESVIVRWRYIR